MKVPGLQVVGPTACWAGSMHASCSWVLARTTLWLGHARRQLRQFEIDFSRTV
jgi:hypothetical protein